MDRIEQRIHGKEASTVRSDSGREESAGLGALEARYNYKRASEVR